MRTGRFLYLKVLFGLSVQKQCTDFRLTVPDSNLEILPVLVSLSTLKDNQNKYLFMTLDFRFIRTYYCNEPLRDAKWC